MPAVLYSQINKSRSDIERLIGKKAKELTRSFHNAHIHDVLINTEIAETENWREKAKAWASGQGMTNQGRVRSDNIASYTFDGLLFRSQPEINLYNALKSCGVSFAPLPVFIRGGQTYRRIEPDFVVIRSGMMMVIEVDGDTVHQETPAEAHARTSMLVHEGVHLERVRAAECDTPDKATRCAQRLLAILAQVQASR